MALETTKISLPKHVAAAIATQVKDSSVIAALSQTEPQMFLDQDYLVFNGGSEAEVLAEGEKKSSYETVLKPVVGKRVKIVTTTRVSSELQYADEDNQLEIINAIQDDQAKAMARALDYVVLHAYDPKKRTKLEGFEALADTATQVTAGGKDAGADLDTLVDSVNDLYDVNGIALSKTYASSLRKLRASGTGMRLYPEIPINLQVGTLDGVNASTSGTVNGRLITPATNILAFCGDFSLIRWGMVRDIQTEMIEYGDPDNTGFDLKGYNQIAYRTEAVMSYTVLDPKGIAVLRSASTSAPASTK